MSGTKKVVLALTLVVILACGVWAGWRMAGSPPTYDGTNVTLYVNGEQVGVVNFADAEQPEVVPWEELKKIYRLDVIKFYEKYIVTRAATEEEVRAVNEGC